MTDLLDVVGTGFQTSNGDLAAGVGSMRTGHQRGTGRVGVNAEFPAIQVLAVLCSFGQAQAAGIQLVGKADRGCTTCGNGYFLRVATGAVVQRIDAAVRMAQFLDIVSTRRQAGNGDLTTGVGGIGTGNQRGTGTIAVDTKAPICKVFSIFRSLGQTEVTQIGRIETEVGIDTARGCTCQRDGGLIGRTRHIPDVIGRIGSRGYILRCGKNRGLRNGSGLIDVQIVAALVELSAVAIRKVPVRENTVTVVNSGFISGESDIGCIGTGTAGETGPSQCALNIGHQDVVIGRKIGNCCNTGIVEDVTCGTTLIGGVQRKGGRITQTTHDLIDQELGCHPERDIGI